MQEGTRRRGKFHRAGISKLVEFNAAAAGVDGLAKNLFGEPVTKLNLP